MFCIVPLGHLHIISSKSIHNFMSNVIYKQTDKPSLPKTQPPLFICLYSLKLNNNKHSRFCKVTHTRDFHGLQLVRINIGVMICFGQGSLHSLSVSSFFLFFFKSLLVACPTHTNPPGLGLGTGGILIDEHIDKSTQHMN